MENNAEPRAGGQPRPAVPTQSVIRGSGFLGFALQRVLQGLVQRGFRFFVLLLRDVALFVLDFELEEFFFQGFKQHGSGASSGRRGCVFVAVRSGVAKLVVGLGIFQGWERAVPLRTPVPRTSGPRAAASCSAGGGLLPPRYEKRSGEQDCRKSAEDGPAVTLQRVGRVDRRAESAAGPTAAWRCRFCFRASLRASTLSFTTALPLLGQRAFAGNLEGQRLSHLRARGDLRRRVGLVGVVHGLVARAWRGSKLHRFGHDGNKVLQRINRFRVNVG